MSRWMRTGATLVLGAGVGAAVSRLLSPETRGEEQRGVGLSGAGGAGVGAAVSRLLSSVERGEEERGVGLFGAGGAGVGAAVSRLLSSETRGEEQRGVGLSGAGGAGVGAAVSRLLSSETRGEEEEGVGLLHLVPVLPVPSVHASELTVSPGSSGAVMKYGFPSLSNIKTRESYVTSYDPRTRTASWVIERLSGSALSGQSDRKYCDFKEDDSVHVFHRSTNGDYRGSGFDRGHLAAAANHKWSQKAMDDTFYLSNVAPQNPQLNQNSWNSLEKLSRSLTRRYLNVYVCTGPLYLPRQEADGKLYVRYQVIGRNHVAVPTHFFKVLILEQPDGRGVELRSYVLPNEPIDEKVPLERFLVPIETIERASGLLFVPNIMKRTSSLQAIAHK